MLPTFDWKNPEPGYALIWEQRGRRLQMLRERPELLPPLKEFYRDNPAQFIMDWGVTVDPRRVERGLESMMPFVMFQKQVDWIDWVVERWKSREPGITDKSRDEGLSWLAVALGCTLCLFHAGTVVGYGSRVEDLVDKIGDPKCLFWKARIFMQELPREFRPGWDENWHAPRMRIVFPHNGSAMVGEAGDAIGRGGRSSLFIVDESAFLKNPQSVDMALSQNTNCRIDISTPNGMAGSFAERRHSGKIKTFQIHWRDDPRKDEAWYAKQVAELDPVTVAQEIDINYAASVEGVVIPHTWLLACVDAAKRLNVQLTGEKSAALDIADEGTDKNAACSAHGIELTALDEWSGIGADIFDTVEKAFIFCDRHGITRIKYDADGLGAGARGDARILNKAREVARLPLIDFVPFRGSAAVFNPDGEDVKGRKNKDYFANRKAQGWWSLRTRVRNTFRLVKEGILCSHDEIISIPSTLPNFTKLISELSQPTYSVNSVGKIIIDKHAGGKSPNLGDVVMMKFASVERGPMQIDKGVLAAAAKLGLNRRR